MMAVFVYDLLISKTDLPLPVTIGLLLHMRELENVPAPSIGAHRSLKSESRQIQ